MPYEDWTEEEHWEAEGGFHEFDDPYLLWERLHGEGARTEPLTPDEVKMQELTRLYSEMEGQATPMPEGIWELFLGMGVGGWVLLAAGVVLTGLGIRAAWRGGMREAMGYLGACAVPLLIGWTTGLLHVLPILSRYHAAGADATWRDLNMTGLAMGLTPLGVGFGMTVVFVLAGFVILVRSIWKSEMEADGSAPVPDPPPPSPG